MLDNDYQILKIIFRNNGEIRLNNLQKSLKEIIENEIPLSTLNSSLERMEKSGYIDWVRYYPIKLTQEGKNLAKELIRHAQLLELFLYNELNLTIEDAHKESEKLNLMLSCTTINKICEKYNHPMTCPCGESILNSVYCYCVEEFKRNE